MRSIFINHQYVSEDAAKISVFDRGFLFADAIYEITPVIEGKLIDFDGHFTRLKRSLGELDMGLPMEREALLDIHRQLIRRNNIKEGLVYLQITRGVADRDFAFPPEQTEQTIVAFTQQKTLINNPAAVGGIKIITLADLRWGRCDIKTVQLLCASLGKMEAKTHGADDAWLLADGYVTEGTSNNAYIVNGDGVIITRNLSHRILGGITRKAVLKCAAELDMKVEERPFSPEEAKQAHEAFCTSATTFVMPVVEIDGHKIGTGTPGPVAKSLRKIYISESLKSAI
ncbi:D-alanine aminotransferase [hydrothermal vent metagenome]|uniref:D-alanine aminotransferase n=1 Tax=hydrothermal vent metagenome TaxID=652676 RepID=A0A3B0TVB0_9ZZZZ